MNNYTSEADLQRDCNKFLDYLKKQGFPIDYIHLPKMVNAYKKGMMGKNKSRKGKLDLYIFLPVAKTIIIELKIENRNLEPEQAESIDLYSKMGFDTYVINDDLQEFKKIIQEELGI